MIIRTIFCSDWRMGTFQLINDEEYGGYQWVQIPQHYDAYRLDKDREEAFNYKGRAGYLFYETDLEEEE